MRKVSNRVPPGPLARCLGAVIVAGLAASPGFAQDGWRLRVTPQGFATYSVLSIGRAIPLETGDYLLVDRLPTLVGGAVSVSAMRDGSPWGLRAELFRSHPRTVEATWDCASQPTCPSILVQSPIQITFYGGTLDVLYSHPSWGDRLRTFFGAGLGWRAYDFTWPGGGLDFLRWAEGERNRSSLALSASLGTRLIGPRVAPWFEIGDYIGSMRSPGNGLTHDIVFKAGLTVRL